METVSIKKKGDFQTSLWSGGSTTQLYIYPEDGDYKQGNFQCRISSATVEAERSDFTKLPGVKRYLSIFQGHLDLVHGEEQAGNMLRRLDVTGTHWLYHRISRP